MESRRAARSAKVTFDGKTIEKKKGYERQGRENRLSLFSTCCVFNIFFFAETKKYVILQIEKKYNHEKERLADISPM